jgi:sugar phosphate isomerase/epimerase
MTPKFKIAAITDEFSSDLGTALNAMKPIGMTGAELRVVGGKNIMDLSDEELEAAKRLLLAEGFHVVSIASPLLKCVLPKAPAVDTRFQHDVFASKHSYEDQPRLTDHAFKLAKFFNAPIVRVFSYWRTVKPEECFDAIVKKENLIVGLENEHACNIATGRETARVLAAVDHPNLKVVWDPANALVAGEMPIPDGYRVLDPARVAHVHAKDCHMENQKPEWWPLGTRSIDWKGQIEALIEDEYQGWLSLETHWPGPTGNKLEGSTICGWNLRGLASA